MSPRLLPPMTLGILLGFGGFVVFTLSDACVKLVQGEIAPYESAFIGAVFALLSLPLLRGHGERLSDAVRTVNRPLWWVRFVCYPLGVIGSVTAFTHLSMAEAFVLIFLQPAFITALSVLWLREKVDWRGWASLAIGFLGVLVVLRPGFRELSIGHLGALAAGLCGAASVLCTRALGARETRISLLGAGFLGGVVICGLVSLPGFVWPTPAQWLKLAGYGLLAAAGNWMVMRAALYAPAAYVAPTQYSQMIWAIILDYLVFRTSIDLPTLLGIVMIVGSGLLTIAASTRASRSARIQS